jgi:DNA-binding NarL/FixJ family response regulator
MATSLCRFRSEILIPDFGFRSCLTSILIAETTTAKSIEHRIYTRKRLPYRFKLKDLCMETTTKKVPREPNGGATTKAKTKRRVLLVDDHPIVREGLTEMVNHEDDLTVCGTAEEMNQALDQIEKLRPDLVVLDISLKGSNGIEVLKNIKVRYPKMLVLVLSMHDETLYALRALRAGASGYIMKQEHAERVLGSIRQVLNGEISLSENMEKKMMKQLVGGRAARTGSPLEDLSDRELEVFRLIGKGYSTRQIAEELHLSIKTIESHRAHIKEKLNLKNAMELVQHAIQWQEV